MSWIFDICAKVRNHLLRAAILPGVAARWEQLVSAGTHDYPRDVRRRLRVLNVVTYIIIIATIAYVIQHTLLDFETYKPVIFINLMLIVVATAVPFTHRIHETAGGIILGSAELLALFAFSAYLGRPAGMQLQYFVLAAAPFVVFGISRLYLAFTFVLLGLVFHLISWFYFPRFQTLISVDKATLNQLYFIATITTVALISASVYYAYSLAEQARAEVDSLLRNILPDSVADRLADDREAQVFDKFDSVSVMFVDLVGFTPMAASLGLDKTVQMLNRLVSKLDQLAAEEGVEKIKTIGDAYMAVSGVPIAQADHMEKMARMALKVRRAVHETATEEKLDIGVRIGIAAGPVLAGIIGTHKFSYDVWGETVNLASRMESHGEPGAIQVNEVFKHGLERRFRFTDGGIRDIKGVGQLQTYFLSESEGQPH